MIGDVKNCANKRCQTNQKKFAIASEEYFSQKIYIRQNVNPIGGEN